MKLAEKTTLPKKIFATDVNPQLMAQAVRIHLSNQRRAVAKTKTRGQVEGSTRKLFKQKGTGRARHGAIRAPIFVGGGIAHGPDGRQNHSMVLPETMRKVALASALTDKAKSKKISIITDTSKSAGQTKEAVKMLTELKLKKVLVVSSITEIKFNRAWRNLSQVNMISPQNLNTYVVLAAPHILITDSALEELQKRYVA